MSAIGNELLSETLRFIETCQDLFLRNNTDIYNYQKLTKTKLEFISCIIENEKEKLFDKNNIFLRVNAVISNNAFICSLSNKNIS